MNLFEFPLEPLDKRYTSQWRYWFGEAFAYASHEGIIQGYCRIDAVPLTSTIEKGGFLDICGTSYYKALQLSEISKRIHNGQVKNGDILFFHDLWFPGIESLAYIRDALGIDFKIVGCLHSGTYDPTDYISLKGMGSWGEPLENSWFSFIDRIYVATNWHKRLLVKNRAVHPWKVNVTGFPLIHPDLQTKSTRPINIKKEDTIVFPHRLDAEKHPEKFDALQDKARELGYGWAFVKTMEHDLSKQAYYDLLRSAKVAISFADHENWGIGMQEATMLGAYPIVPKRASYVELFPTRYVYGIEEEVFPLLEAVMNSYDDEMQDAVRNTGLHFSRKWAKAIPTMMATFRELA